jgi:hypothetical protein
MTVSRTNQKDPNVRTGGYSGGALSLAWLSAVLVAGLTGSLFVWSAMLRQDPDPALAGTDAARASAYEIMIDGVPRPRAVDPKAPRPEAKRQRAQLQAVPVVPKPRAPAVKKQSPSTSPVLTLIETTTIEPIGIVLLSNTTATSSDWPAPSNALTPSAEPSAPILSPQAGALPEAKRLGDGLPFVAPALPRTPTLTKADQPSDARRDQPIAAPIDGPSSLPQEQTAVPARQEPPARAFLSPVRPKPLVSKPIKSPQVKPGVVKVGTTKKISPVVTAVPSPRRPRPVVRRQPRPEPPIVPAWANRID